MHGCVSGTIAHLLPRRAATAHIELRQVAMAHDKTVGGECVCARVCVCIVDISIEESVLALVVSRLGEGWQVLGEWCKGGARVVQGWCRTRRCKGICVQGASGP